MRWIASVAVALEGHDRTPGADVFPIQMRDITASICRKRGYRLR